MALQSLEQILNPQQLNAFLGEVAEEAVRRMSSLSSCDRSVPFTLYGGAKEFVEYRGSEAVLSGPAETGKTVAALCYLHQCACDYPGASIVIARKTQQSTYNTVIKTFEEKVITRHLGNFVHAYGGQKPEWYDYDNGSKVLVVGLDKPAKFLSGEYDIVYFNQAEEGTVDDWEIMTTRATGRAGNMPYAQVIGDMNPAYPQHWIYHRDGLKIFYSFHRENPLLFDQETGEITEQGERTMAVLNRLTGVRKIRLLDGKPAQAEGAIYEDWDNAIHLIDRDKLPELRQFIAGQDWGFTNPGCLGVWGIDSDGRMYLVAQIYRARQLIDWWTQRALELHREYRINPIICDPSEPAYIEAYRAAGLNAIPGYNRVRPGIDVVQSRLRVAEDEKPRMFIVRDGLRYPDDALIAERKIYAVEQEFPAYVWADRVHKEEPVKENDHGMDMTRYTVAFLDIPREVELSRVVYNPVRIGRW
jgi:phage terminase large subunit